MYPFPRENLVSGANYVTDLYHQSPFNLDYKNAVSHFIPQNYLFFLLNKLYFTPFLHFRRPYYPFYKNPFLSPRLYPNLIFTIQISPYFMKSYLSSPRSSNHPRTGRAAQLAPWNIASPRRRQSKRDESFRLVG